MSKALLLIDIQNDYFKGGLSELVDPLQAVDNAKKILTTFRENKLPVIHIQHINTREGATFFLPNTVGVKIHVAVEPLESEYIVIKHAPNSFFETNLGSILKENNIESLVVCGMMSHMCIDTTVRAAKDYGIDVTLIEDACTTKDLSFNGTTIPAKTVHNSFMAALNGMFAKVIKTSELII
ncbi:cysteine hydrolase family protein [Lacrimispora brassicae]